MYTFLASHPLLFNVFKSINGIFGQNMALYLSPTTEGLYA